MVNTARIQKAVFNMRCMQQSCTLFTRILVLLMLYVSGVSFTPIGESQVVTLSFKDAPLQQVFAAIRKQTGYSFAYFDTDLAQAKRVTITFTNTKVQEVLNTIFKDQPLTYTIIEKVVVIKMRAEKKIPQEQGSVADIPIDIRGRVLNEQDDPVVRVSIQVKGTKIGTYTNEEGEFELKNVDANAVLLLTAVNIQPIEASVAGQRNLNLRVKGKTGQLDEVQVIAYGTTSQRISTGNIFTVKAEDIAKQPIQNPLLALQGRVPGIEIIQTSGISNGYVKVRIQGQNSITDSRNEPLIVVDGVPYPSRQQNDRINGPFSANDQSQGASPLSFINPADIESIDVLKDADATAIYGSRGANGAILITTKKGKAGKTKIDIRLQQGWGKVTRKLDLMNTRQYLDMRYEALRNDNLPINSASNIDLILWDTTRYTDWQKVLIGETAQYTNANASISGGTNAVRYLVGATYARQTDVFPGDFSNRSGTVHFNIGASSPNQKFRLQLSGSYMYNENNLPSVDLTEAALSLEPVAPALFNPDGSLNWAPNNAGTTTWENPLMYLAARNIRYRTNNLLSSATVSYLVLPGLQLKTTLGYNVLNGSGFRATPLEYYRPELKPNASRESVWTTSINTNWIVEPQLNYQVKLNALKIETLAGATIQKSQTEGTGLTGTGFSSDLLMRSAFSATTVSANTNNTIYRYAALFGRINFNFSNKYVINMTLRRDASSRFGDANKMHNFTSFAGAWLWGEESFIKKHLPFLSFGKLRSSYGTTGSDAIGDYSYLSTYSTTTSTLVYQGVRGLVTNGISNPHLQWEEVKKLSIGTDLGFFSDRFLLGVSFNRNTCSNQLQATSLPTITGATAMALNLPATVRNTTWEFTLNTTNIRTKMFSWSTNLNITIPNNKLLSYPDYENSTWASGLRGVVIGYPLGVIKTLRYYGLDPATGVPMVYDANGNLTSTPNSSTDRTVAISTIPKFYGGFNNSLSFKGFQLDFLFQFVQQLGERDRYYYNRISPPGRFQAGRSNQALSVLDRWQKTGDHTDKVRFTTKTTSYSLAASSDANYTYAASFIRLKNLSLSWQIPANWINGAGLQNASVNFQAQNLLTISGFTGLDPETGAGSALPPLRMLTAGIQLGF